MLSCVPAREKRGEFGARLAFFTCSPEFPPFQPTLRLKLEAEGKRGSLAEDSGPHIVAVACRLQPKFEQLGHCIAMLGEGLRLECTREAARVPTLLMAS